MTITTEYFPNLSNELTDLEQKFSPFDVGKLRRSWERLDHRILLAACQEYGSIIGGAQE
jgi:hypothetical protein